MLKAICTAFQMNLAKWQSKNKCWMLSSALQKLHFVLPFHFLFARLSLVRVTPFFRYQRKILVLRGTFIFQVIQSEGVPSLCIKLVYMDFIVNCLWLVKFHMKISFPFIISYAATFSTKSSQVLNLSPERALLKEMLRGTVLRILATVSFFLFAIQ